MTREIRPEKVADVLQVNFVEAAQRGYDQTVPQLKP